MKILIYTCNYAPEPIGTGKFTGEMAEWLSSQGYEIRVVAAPPFYPTQPATNTYSARRYKHHLMDRITIVRCPIWVPKTRSGIARLFSTLSFAVSSTPTLLWWALRWRPDIIWTVVPVIAGVPTALLGSKLAGSKSWLHVQDFEVDAAFELGLLKSTIGRTILSACERMLLSHFDVVSSITPRMIDKLTEKGISASLKLFPNWADIDSIFPMEKCSTLRRELGIPETAFVGLYSGNLGEKQGVECLIEVARKLKTRPDIAIVICGDGAGRERLAKISKGLKNVWLAPLQPLERLNELLNIADVHLLPQKAKIADFVMPSKLGGMLASGRPVIAGAAAGTQLAQEVEGCGIAVPPENASAMAEALLKLQMSDELRTAFGAAAVQRARARWGKPSIMSQFEQTLRRTGTATKPTI